MIDWTRDFYIHTPYQDQAEHVCEILDALGYTWSSGDALPGFTNWRHNKNKMHYHVHPGLMCITYTRCPSSDIASFTYEEFIEDYCGTEEPIAISEFL